MTILQALDHYYDRMAARNDAVLPGWSNKPIGVVLELAEDGTLLALEARLDDRGKPLPARVPKWFSRSGTGSTPYFLWDNVAYVLGLGDKDPGKTGRDHEAFKALHLKELADETDAGLVALRRFLERWDPADGLPPGFSERFLTFSIGFRLRGETRLLQEHPSVAAHVERLSTAEPAGAEGFCLVRGQRLPLIRLHPKIKGVNGTASAEVPLVSFEQSAFTSYGKTQGFNAPTSEAAAFRYGAALNALLTRGGRNRLQIADASVAYWADASAYDAAQAEALARAAEDVFGAAFEETPPAATTDDEQQSAAVGEALAKVASGRAEPDVTPALLDGVSFHVLGLAPNVARLSVRYWVSDSFARFREALDRHASAVAIEPPPWHGKRPAIQRLLVMTTALQEKFENIPDGLAGEVMRAVLTGTPYPRTWLAAAIIRLRAGDDPRRGWHAAAIKACLSRMNNEETPPVSRDPDNSSQAYQLGRLFAVLEAAQRAALGRVNASIADRYYGAASAMPARVFGTLMRGARNHISDARKRNQGLWIDSRLEEIMSHLQPDLPRTLRLEDQGRFAIGYYHERAFRSAKSEANADDDAIPSDTQETI
jgi:CRISPR-associated protein Csd1